MALRKKAVQSTTQETGVAERAVDGNTDSIYIQKSCTHSKKEKAPWWYVDLGRTYQITDVYVYNRKDCCGEFCDMYAYIQRK